MGDRDRLKSTFCGCCTREGDRKSTNKNILQYYQIICVKKQMNKQGLFNYFLFFFKFNFFHFKKFLFCAIFEFFSFRFFLAFFKSFQKNESL